MTQLVDDGWMEWRGGICPVAPTVRVEVVQEMRHARGLALAFDWVEEDGPRAVHFWRHESTVAAGRRRSESEKAPG